MPYTCPHKFKHKHRNIEKRASFVDVFFCILMASFTNNAAKTSRSFKNSSPLHPKKRQRVREWVRERESLKFESSNVWMRDWKCPWQIQRTLESRLLPQLFQQRASVQLRTLSCKLNLLYNTHLSPTWKTWKATKWNTPATRKHWKMILAKVRQGGWVKRVC